MSNRKYEIPNGDEVDIARASAAVLTKLLQDLPNDHRASIRMGGAGSNCPTASCGVIERYFGWYVGREDYK
jgi:hypothetical protein